MLIKAWEARAHIQKNPVKLIFQLTETNNIGFYKSNSKLYFGLACLPIFISDEEIHLTESNMNHKMKQDAARF